MFLAKPKKTAEEKALEAERDKQREMLRARPLPKVKVPLVGAEAKGDPAAVDWSKAVELGTWHTVLGDPASRRISTCLLHDGKYLYLRLAEETEVSRLVSKNVFSGDDWELFFAAERERYPYRQLAISPNGEFKEIGHGEREWASGAKVLSDTSNPKQWTVKIAIPLDKLLPQGVGPGRKVYANFYRQGMRIAKPGEPGKQVDADTNLLAWSPNFTASFHALDRLGELDLE